MSTDTPVAQLRQLRKRRERLLEQLEEIERSMATAMAAEKAASRMSDERLGAEAGVTRETATRWRRRAEREAADKLIDKILAE